MNGLALSRCRSASRSASISPAATAEAMVRPASRISPGLLGGPQRGHQLGLLARLLGQLGDPVVDGLEVGQDQLGVDRLDVVRPGRSGRRRGSRRDRSKTRTTWQMASLSRMAARNLLPRPSPSDAPFTMPAMSTKVTMAGTISLESKISARTLEARVGDGHHPDVGLDGGERVVGGQDLVAGQGVEQGGLPHVGETDDADGQSHGCFLRCRRRTRPARGSFERR